MPHIYLRTSSNLVENVDITDILHALVECLAQFESIEQSSIKAYHTLHTNWVMGTGAQPGFAAVQVRLAEGRSPDLLTSIADAMYTTLKESFRSSIVEDEANLTLEICEFPKRLYRKES